MSIIRKVCLGVLNVTNIVLYLVLFACVQMPHVNTCVNTCFMFIHVVCILLLTIICTHKKITNKLDSILKRYFLREKTMSCACISTNTVLIKIKSKWNNL